MEASAPQRERRNRRLAVRYEPPKSPINKRIASSKAPPKCAALLPAPHRQSCHVVMHESGMQPIAACAPLRTTHCWLSSPSHCGVRMIHAPSDSLHCFGEQTCHIPFMRTSPFASLAGPRLHDRQVGPWTSADVIVPEL